MPPTSAAMELKVLINILTQGQALPQLLAQTKQLQTALTTLQNQANAAGGAGTGFSNVAGSAQKAAGAVQGASTAFQNLGNTSKAATTGVDSLDKALGRVGNMIRWVTGGFLAYQSVRFLKDLADTAARAEVLSTVLRVVAHNSNITAEEIEKVDRKVQSLGITAESSRKSLTQFLQAGLKLEFAPKLARAAQDLAVISGMDSSSTFGRLIINIQQLDTMGLRFMGIVTDRAVANQKYKQQHKEITGELNKRQMQEALMIEVLEKAKLLEGAYSSAMNDVGKQLTSLTRLSQTLRQELGDSLLPAYSAIVLEITTLYEKLIVIGREFSANKERAQILADVVQTLARGFSYIVTVVAEHLDQIVYLITAYAALKTALLTWNLLTGAVGSIMNMIRWVDRLILVLLSSRNATMTFKVAMDAMRAATLAETAATIALAEAQAAGAVVQNAATVGLWKAGYQATLTATAVEGVAVAWGSMIAAFAVPIVIAGATIAAAVKKDADFAKLSLMERAKLARGEQPMGGEMSRLVGEGAMGGEAASQSGLNAPTALSKLFDEWKATFPQIVADIKDAGLLWKEFNRQIDITSGMTVIEEYGKKLGEAKTAVEQAIIAQDKLLHPAGQKEEATVPAVQRIAAGQAVIEAQKAVAAITEEMRKEFEKLPLAKSTRAIGEQADKISAQQQAVGKLKASGAEQKDITAAEAMLTVEKERLTVMVEQHRMSLDTQETMSESAKQYELASGRVLAGIKDAQQAAQDFQTLLKELFGGQDFTDEGVMSAEFKKQFSGFGKLVTQAREDFKQTGDISKATSDALLKNITAMGQAAKTTLDLTRLTEAARLKVGPEPDDLPKVVAGTRAAFGQAIRLAQQGVRKERLAPGAPLLAEELENISRASDARAEAIKEDQSFQKTALDLASLELEQSYARNLTLLDTYFNQKLARMKAESTLELKAQDEVIRELTEKEIAARNDGDTRQAESFKQQLQAARNQRFAIENRGRVSAAQLEGQRTDQRRALDKELKQAIVDQAASVGGVEAKLRQVNLQIDQERDKYFKLGTPLSDQLLAMKRITAEAAIHQQARDEAFEAEMSMSEVLQGRVNLMQAEREVAEAQTRAAVASGRMTEFEARRLNNARTQEAMEANRLLKTQKTIDLELMRVKHAEDYLAKQEELAALQKAGAITADEMDKRLSSIANKQTAEALAQQTALKGLDQAYVELGDSIQSYSKSLQQHFVQGFADAMTQSIMDFRKAGEAWVSLSKSITNEIVSVFVKAFTERLFSKLGLFTVVDRLMNTIFGGGGGGGNPTIPYGGIGLGWSSLVAKAEGGPVFGQGSGTSDSIPALLSNGEHVMPASKAAQWMPLLEGIRTGRILPFSAGGLVQSISMPSVIPHRYAAGGVVMTDGGASAVGVGGGGGNMVVSLHPEALNMTMREWLEHEVVRQQGRR